MKYMKPFNLFQDLLKSNISKRGRLLGLDVGDKYVGLSVSDFDNQVASPFRVLVRKKTNIDLMATDFQTLAVQVKVLINDLSKTGRLKGLKYTFWDECFTTKNVELLLKDLDLHPVQSKSIMDKFAAVGILQGYLDFANRSIRMKSKPFSLMEDEFE